jgi:hypothetical protein
VRRVSLDGSLVCCDGIEGVRTACVCVGVIYCFKTERRDRRRFTMKSSRCSLSGQMPASLNARSKLLLDMDDCNSWRDSMALSSGSLSFRLCRKTGTISIVMSFRTNLGTGRTLLGFQDTIRHIRYKPLM